MKNLTITATLALLGGGLGSLACADDEGTSGGRGTGGVGGTGGLAGGAGGFAGTGGANGGTGGGPMVTGGSGGGGTGGSTGGSGGGTTDNCPAAGGGNDAALIDDMEDGDDAILLAGGRTGFWFTFNDGTGTQSPAMGADYTMAALSPPRDGSTMAAHTEGGGFSGDFGAGMGFSFNASGSTNCPYDASGYTGITFWARAEATTEVRFKVQIPETVGDTEPGGACNSATDTCFDDYGDTISLTTSWQEFTYAWADLSQEGWGTAVSFDASRITAVQFQTAPGVDFDYYVDDIAFTGGTIQPTDGGGGGADGGGADGGGADGGAGDASADSGGGSSDAGSSDSGGSSDAASD